MAEANQTPLYGMTIEQENRFFNLSDRLRHFGYCVLSEPLEGQVENWLEGIAKNLTRIQERLASTNRAYKTRGTSPAALYYLTSNETFDPGFGIHLTYEQSERNKAYKAKLDKGVARWNAAFGE